MVVACITNIYLFAYLWSHCIYIFVEGEREKERERYGQRHSWINQDMKRLTCWMSRPLQLLKLELKLQHQRQETGDGGSLLGHGANCIAQTFQPPEMDHLCGWRGCLRLRRSGLIVHKPFLLFLTTVVVISHCQFPSHQNDHSQTMLFKKEAMWILAMSKALSVANNHRPIVRVIRIPSGCWT